MPEPRTAFAAASGPDQAATGTVQGLDGDPRVYVVGGRNDQGVVLDTCVKYNPNTDEWTSIASLPRPLDKCTAAFVPDYGKGSAARTLGFIYVAGGGQPTLFQYNIKRDEWTELSQLLPFAPVNAALQYLDDIGGPLAQLFTDVTGVDLPPCTDGQTLWAVGGEGTERDVWFIEANQQGDLLGEWARGPTLPLFRSKPLVGRVFWRDAGITSYGVSNCASIIVGGGHDEHGAATDDAQLLVRVDCNWTWIRRGDNPTTIPDNALTLATPVADGAFGTEPWPETLATGGRPILFGGDPETTGNGGSVQFAQLRFSEGRYQRDKCLAPDSNPRTAWNAATSMPGQRVAFKALPLSQDNPSIFGGRRVSRFMCVGGEDEDGNVLARTQLFQLPTPPTFLTVVENANRC